MTDKKINGLHLRFALVLVGIQALGCAADVQQGTEADLELEDETAVSDPQLAAQSVKLWRPAAGTSITSIPVCFESSTGLTSADKDLIQDFAVDAWDTPSRVDFTEWDTCIYTCANGTSYFSKGQCDYDCTWLGYGSCASSPGIHVRKDTRCHVEEIGSAINGVVGGIGLTTPIKKSCVAHEFGHALGFTHEQERSDNDGRCDEDQTQSEPDLGITDWDDDSIMNYCANKSDPSALDILGLRSVYGSISLSLPYSPAWNFNSGTQRYALRAASGHFMQADPDPHDIKATQWHIKTNEKFWIWKVSGPDSNLHYGDTVRFITHDTYVLRALPSANNWVVDKSSSLGSCETWTLVNAASPTSTALVRVNDEVAFRSCYGRYLYRQSDNANVRAPNTTIQSLEKWRILSLPFGNSV